MKNLVSTTARVFSGGGRENVLDAVTYLQGKECSGGFFACSYLELHLSINSFMQLQKILLQTQNCFNDVEKSARLTIIGNILRKTNCVRREETNTNQAKEKWNKIFCNPKKAELTVKLLEIFTTLQHVFTPVICSVLQICAQGPCQENVRGNGGKAPCILALGLKCRRVSSFNVGVLHDQGKITW